MKFRTCRVGQSHRSMVSTHGFRTAIKVPKATLGIFGGNMLIGRIVPKRTKSTKSTRFDISETIKFIHNCILI